MDEERYRRKLLQIDEKIARLYAVRLKITKKAADTDLRNIKKIKKQAKTQALARAVSTCPNPEFIEYLYNLYDLIYKDTNRLKLKIKRLKKLR